MTHRCALCVGAWRPVANTHSQIPPHMYPHPFHSVPAPPRAPLCVRVGPWLPTLGLAGLCWICATGTSDSPIHRPHPAGHPVCVWS